MDIIENMDLRSMFLVTLRSSTFFKMIEEAFYLHYQYHPGVAEGLQYYLNCINPLPSKYINYDFNQYAIGVLNGIDIDNLGLPMPAYVEFYFYFGWYSIVIYMFFIYLFKKLDDNLYSFGYYSKKKRIFTLLLTMATIYAMVKAGHSSFRSTFRMVEIIIILYIGYSILIYILPKKRRKKNG
jgi:hypothetical protein